MPEAIDAQQASLDAYNEAARQTQVAEEALKALQAQARPADSALGHDAGGKQYDLDYKAAQDALAAAQAQAATAARQYATIIEQQAQQQAQQNTPTAQANAERARAMADYYRARADGYAAKDASTQANATTRAQAALTRADSAASRVDAQNNQANAAAAANNAQAASTAARTPAEIAQAQASAAANMAQAANISARTPAEIAQAQASANASNANAVDAQARARLVDLQAQQLAENDPLVKAHLQAQIDQLQAQAAAQSKPSLEPGYQNASRVPLIAQNPDTKQWEVQWVDNQGQPMVATDALKSLADQIKLNLGDGPGQIPLQTAKDLFGIAHQVIDDQTNRQQANNQGANVGAGLLQNRVNAASGMVNNVLSGAAGNKNFGLGTQLPAGFGGQLLSDVGNFTTQMGGGQDVYDTARALVQRANPALANDPNAIGPLAVMLDQHKSATGTDHPAVTVANSTFQPPSGSVNVGIPPYLAPNGMDNSPAAVVHAAVSAAVQPFAQSGIAEGSSRGRLPSFQAPGGGGMRAF